MNSSKYAEYVFLAEEMARAMNRQVAPLTAATAGLTAVETQEQGTLAYANWLNSGPDDYDALEETLGASELRHDYSPQLLWGGSVFNDSASGGPNILLRFTDTVGQVKQYPIPPGTAFNLVEMKGRLGSVFRYVADSQTQTADARCLILLKNQYQA